MKPFEKRSWSIPVWFVVFGVVCLLTVLSGYWLFQVQDARLVGIVSGLFTGLLLYGLALIPQTYIFLELERYKSIGVKALLDNRHDQSYYRPLVAGAREFVWVTGASTTRFIEDFLDPLSDNATLLEAMRSNTRLTVRLLIPDDEYMKLEARSRFAAKAEKLKTLKSQLGNRFELRRFNDWARHSFVVVDGDIIGGPIFDSDNSKHAPAVHVDGSKPFARKYRDYFETLWGDSVPYN
ncbi:hypothetical protein AB9E29_16010 [Rhizobium leguminosarum]|uniref:hypothetical protein n=1 Tax=Rhizobium leguminosarum TaxID=384 RepID=UPI003F983252